MSRLDIPASDAIVIGAGPNGLAAAIVLAQAGCSVTVLEAGETVGGGARSAELTLPGIVHDVCSAIHPTALASPFFCTLPLAQHGLQWIHPLAPLAHPLDGGRAVVLHRSVEDTAQQLGADERVYREFFGGLLENWERLLPSLLAPPVWPRAPWQLARFGVNAMRSARGFARSKFRTEAARALFAGLAGHSMLPLHHAVSAGFGLVLGLAAHAVGWPIARSGSQSIADALASYLRSLGGNIITGTRVQSLNQLPRARATLCDITPRQLLHMAGDRLPRTYCRQLEQYRYGMGAYKIDWALDAPVPWESSLCRQAGTLHLGGSLDEIATSETAVWNGRHAERPLVLLAQPTLFDNTRAPAGQHTLWGYCHVPNGSVYPMLDRVEAQIERFAPGFRRHVLARSIMDTAALECHNPNLVGGDIAGGAPDLRQLFLRPTWRVYTTPVKGLYLCSSSTPPGGGVHGMCGYFAGKLALHEVF